MTGTLTLTYGCLFGCTPEQEYREHLRTFTKERECAAKKAIQDGKEPFDFPKFAALYAHDTGSCERLEADASTEVQNYYRNMYYKDFPQVLTVCAFARLLNDLDAQG